MNDDAALLRAVLLNPEDTIARLVLADWWEEYGSEEQRARGELVQLQCGPVAGSVAKVSKIASHGGNLWLTAGLGVTTLCWRWEQEGALGFSVEAGHVHHEREPRFCLAWNRGFVERARCRLKDVTEDVARAMFSAHPITAVSLADRNPVAGDGGRQFVWAHYERLGPGGESESSSPGYLPRHLFDLLLPDPKCVRVRDATGASFISTREYRKEKHARDALSHACVRWGRSLAGLPPLAGGEQP